MAFELRSTLFEDDPYPRMKHFRENDPVHYAGEHQGWYLFRHADALELLHDERFSSEQGWPDLSKVPELLRPMMEMRPRWMLNRDAPEHTRLRKPVARAFSPRRAEQLSPRAAAGGSDSLQIRQRVLRVRIRLPPPLVCSCRDLLIRARSAGEVPAIPRGFGRGPGSGSSGDGRAARPMAKQSSIFSAGSYIQGRVLGSPLHSPWG